VCGFVHIIVIGVLLVFVVLLWGWLDFYIYSFGGPLIFFCPLMWFFFFFVFFVVLCEFVVLIIICIWWRFFVFFSPLWNYPDW